jgi:hypothetical protein
MKDRLNTNFNSECDFWSYRPILTSFQRSDTRGRHKLFNILQRFKKFEILTNFIFIFAKSI